MAYKMQSECLETKKITYVLIAGPTPMSEACARGIGVNQLFQH